jgi:hypothetical protein
MICYSDMTFCKHYKGCKKVKECGRALTFKVKQDAAKWWGSADAPIATWTERPDCYRAEENDNGQ